MKDGQDFNRWHFAGGYARRRGKEVEGLEVGRAGAGPGRHGYVIMKVLDCLTLSSFPFFDSCD